MTLLISAERNIETLKRLPREHFGEPEDVANTVLFLASGEAQYIEGITLPFNGG